MEKNNKVILVLGGSGCLGKVLIQMFLTRGWNVINIDHRELELEEKKKDTKESKENPSNIQFISNLFKQGVFEQITIPDKEYDLSSIRQKIEQFLNAFNVKKLDVIVNCAGGFLNCGLKEDNIIKSMNDLIDKNLISAVLAAHIASNFLITDGGLLVLVGSSKVFKENCSNILLYQTSKTALHSFALGLKDCKEFEKFCLLTILP